MPQANQSNRPRITYDGRHIAIVLPPRVLADALVPDSDPMTFDKLVDAIGEANALRAGIEEQRQEWRLDMHEESVQELADNFGDGREVHLDVEGLLRLIQDATAVLADYSLIGDTGAVTAMYAITCRLRNEAARDRMIAARTGRPALVV